MFGETDIARDILAKRYYAPGETKPEELLKRVAMHVAQPEDDQDRWAQTFYDMMLHGQFLPNSPCLHNAGRGGGLFACFVIGMEDSLGSISQAKTDAMAITKAGGGWGIDIGKLRPKGAKVVGSTHGIAGGPVGFWETFSHDMHTMTQGGFRDAACMATMRVDHPDILEFIRAKTPVNSVARLLNLDSLFGDVAGNAIALGLLNLDVIKAAAETYMSNFNISVLLDNKFMDAAVNGHDYFAPGSIFDNMTAFMPPDLLYELAEHAWENGEPGILFIDTLRKRTRYKPASISATNPCGEQALPPNGSCCLGSINISAFVHDRALDMVGLEETIHHAVRFLDNMITQNEFPTEETKKWALANRAIGLGIMGWADALTMMDIPYDSEAAVEYASMIAADLRKVAEEASTKLYKEKWGLGWDGRRNRALLSIAPTGTISLLAGCSPGIEPPFRGTTTRIDRTGQHELQHRLADEPAFRTVETIDPKWVIRHVAAFSEYIDNSVSYTVNLPNSATIEDVKDCIIMAWKKGCNGITIYRDGSRVRQVLNDAAPVVVEEGYTYGVNAEDYVAAKPKRPQKLEGTTYKYSAHVSGENVNVYVTVNTLHGKPWEVFVNTPYIQSQTEIQLMTMATRMSSLSLRRGVPVTDLIGQLRKVEGQSLLSIPAIIANALSEYCEVEALCPDCGAGLKFSGGCNACLECGYSTCG